MFLAVKAIQYLLNHWRKLTLFLRHPGAPIDNNIRERVLKKAIFLHRKNSLFYRTKNGARVGDMFMSLIYTAELSGANPFDYLTQLHRHGAKLAPGARQDFALARAEPDRERPRRGKHPGGVQCL